MVFESPLKQKITYFTVMKEVNLKLMALDIKFTGTN